MRPLMLVLASLAAAILLCGLLAAFGVLNFNEKTPEKRGAVSTAQTVKKTNAEPARKALPALKQEATFPDQATPVPKVAQEPGAAKSLDTGKTDNHVNSKTPGIENGSENPAVNNAAAGHYSRGLAFLKSFNSKSGDAERGYADFLRNELDMTDEEIEESLKMAFWKNFVTLQKKWHAGETDRMVLMFEHELALKKAGFAAKGLTLFSGGLEAARSKMLELKKTIYENTASKTGSQQGGAP